MRMVQIRLWEILTGIVQGVSIYLFNSLPYRYACRNIKRTIGRELYRLLVYVVKLEHYCTMRLTACCNEKSIKVLKVESR